ncbi:MAG: hypothetical protein QW153_02860 [Candidatus Bilamarchaeaceae archaeon]
MGFFDFLSSIFGPKKAIYYFSCPKCGAECESSSERCAKCGFNLHNIIARKCPRCGSLNELDNGRCTKCGYNLASDKSVRFIYVCPVCANEYEKYISICKFCSSSIE